MGNNKKGRGVVRIFLLLSALAGVFVFFFPLIEKKMPSLAKTVNDFRGYYSGSLFIDPADSAGGGEKEYFTNIYHGIKSEIKEEQVYYFIPAADIKLIFYSYYKSFDSTLLLNLYRADSMKTVIATNLDVPFESGRQRGAYSQMGQDVPDHANWFSFKCKKGVEYALKVLPEEKSDIGKEFVVRINADDGWISMPGLWIFFEIILIFLLIFYYAARIVTAVRKKN